MSISMERRRLFRERIGKDFIKAFLDWGGVPSPMLGLRTAFDIMTHYPDEESMAKVEEAFDKEVKQRK